MSAEEKEWVLAEGTHEGNPMFVRFARFGESFRKDNYPLRVDVTWSMSEVEQFGLPSASEMERMEAFENRLCAAVEDEGHSLLAFTITTGGSRYLMFYTNNAEAFVEQLQSMPHPEGQYPISLAAEEDPSWSYYSEFVR